VLGACLLATLAIAGGTNAQAKNNANFDAGIAAYQPTTCLSPTKKFSQLPRKATLIPKFNVALMYERASGW